MNEEEKNMKNDILFQIDMQLYDEFNDTIATMNDNLGNIYSLRDVEEVEKAEKDKEIKLLRKAIEKQQKELNKEKEKNKKYENKIKAVLELIDTKPYTAYTLYGDILYDDENIRELLEERN